jgi:cobalamin biosynthesis Mg chelatase CobN
MFRHHTDIVQDQSKKKAPAKDHSKKKTPVKRKGDNLQKKTTPKTNKKTKKATEDSTNVVPNRDSAARAEEEIPLPRSVLVVVGLVIVGLVIVGHC